MKHLVSKYYHGGKVADIGSAIVENQLISYKDFFNNDNYIGVDLTNGQNVSVIHDLENSPLNNPVDFIVCGQVLEHVKRPWVFFENIKGSLNKNGIAIIIAPSSGQYHAYPIDCYRYFSEGLCALSVSAELAVLESGTLNSAPWNDSFVVVKKC